MEAPSQRAFHCVSEPRPRTSRGRCKCGVGCLHAEYCVEEHRRVKAESCGNRGKKPGDAEIEPVDRDEPAGGAGNHAQRVGVHGRDGAADAQGDVEKSEAQPEQQIGRTDDAQVEGAKTRDLDIVAEQADP